MKLFPSRCEAFPTYPRTYDMVHGEGILSLEFGEKQRCEMIDVFTEIDRILRPEVSLSLSRNSLESNTLYMCSILGGLSSMLASLLLNCSSILYRHLVCL